MHSHPESSTGCRCRHERLIPCTVRRDGAWGMTAGGGVAADAVAPPAPAWPLYYEGDRRTRFAYAIYALNKVGARG
jgi:hypothetical protein